MDSHDLSKCLQGLPTAGAASQVLLPRGAALEILGAPTVLPHGSRPIPLSCRGTVEVVQNRFGGTAITSQDHPSGLQGSPGAAPRGLPMASSGLPSGVRQRLPRAPQALSPPCQQQSAAQIHRNVELRYYLHNDNFQE